MDGKSGEGKAVCGHEIHDRDDCVEYLVDGLGWALHRLSMRYVDSIALLSQRKR